METTENCTNCSQSTITVTHSNNGEYIFDRTYIRVTFLTLYTIVFCLCFFGEYIAYTLYCCNSLHKLTNSKVVSKNQSQTKKLVYFVFGITKQLIQDKCGICLTNWFLESKVRLGEGSGRGLCGAKIWWGRGLSKSMLFDQIAH